MKTQTNNNNEIPKGECSKCKEIKDIYSLDAFSSYQLCLGCHNKRKEEEILRRAKEMLNNPSLMDKLMASQERIKGKERYKDLYEYNLKILKAIEELKLK